MFNPTEPDYDVLDQVRTGRALNSQSGKGGIARLLSTGCGVELPRRLQIDFARHVQRHTDPTGAEVTAKEPRELLQEVRCPGRCSRSWRSRRRTGAGAGRRPRNALARVG
ncbi:hypothetical protein [Amycolatopsis methanolica]|uniref:hypothetical protein n=1 Tax=Amycolatopsis methanolica TaxID=1814 RepID=UPI00344133F3